MSNFSQIGTVFAANKEEEDSQTVADKNGGAKWIWGKDFKTQNNWTAFRKTVKLDSIPEKVVAKIAIDSKYWLYINDKLVVFEGEAKRGPNKTDTYMDQVDIAKYLKSGENTIAVLGEYFGRDGYSYSSSGHAGFLFEANATGVNIVSDESWKVLKLDAYGASATKIPNERIVESCIRYDAQEEVSGWQTSSFDDSDWDNAIAYGIEGDEPWNKLVDRTIPELKFDEDYRIFDQSAIKETQDSDSSTMFEIPTDDYAIEATFTVANQ
ncbi:MAG: alpha-L-rhamnosidase N-terminal domain-containing protein [Suipraeoptans sp.]